MTSTLPRKRVLLVEDEAGFRDVLQIGLEPAGFDTEPAEGLTEAVEILTRQSFDAIVSDLRLKDGSGIDLLVWLKDHGMEIPVVIMTAFATTETTVKALNLGAVDFLTKTKNDIQELTKVLKGLFAASMPSLNYEISNIGDLIGVGETIRKVQALVGKVARADTTVLITGAV
ncbi:MAG TPA: response regulator, partial [Holophaga sp.]|nr:response regulator [Holophaga sp.]